MSSHQAGYSACVAALDSLIRETAAASPEARTFLMQCRSCRNRLLYLLDTAPAEGPAVYQGILRARIRVLPQNHALCHQNPGARDHGDSRLPQIRWITS